MKRVIRFQRTRYYFFAFSICLTLAGVAGYLLRGGFNLGVDFRAGVALQFQVAPPSFSIQYSGPGTAAIDIPSGEQALTAAGDFIVTVTAPDGSRTSVPFKWNDYATIQQFSEALQSKVSGLTVQLKGDPNASPKELLPLVRTADITAAPFTLNLQPQAVGGAPVTISEVRSVLAPLGSFDLQEVSAPVNQQFIARVQASGDDPSFQTATQQKLTDLLGKAYGADHVVVQSVNFVGPKMARSLGVQAVWLTPGTVDPFSPKVVRSAMGAHFRLPIHSLTWEAIRQGLAPQPGSPALRVYLSDSGGGLPYTQADFRSPLALVIGGEAEGASLQAQELASERVHIPMPGAAESLNAAVAAAIFMFEVTRQRQ